MPHIQIKRWDTGAILHEGEFVDKRACLEDAVRRDISLEFANLEFANLEFANLEFANLGYANLGYANLGYANLGYANLGYANLRYAVLHDGIPIIPNIHQVVYKSLLPTVNSGGTPKALDMGSWHDKYADCGTTHCWAGWICAKAGPAGACLEGQIGTGAAAALILMASDTTCERIPNWYDTGEGAWKEIQRLAGVNQ